MRLFGTETITQWEEISLTITTMRSEQAFYLRRVGDKAELSRFLPEDSEKDEGSGSLQLRYASAEDVLSLLQRCRILRWDRFHGKHPRRIKDGTTFRLTARLNGREICASGSQNFPPHFREFHDGIRQLFQEGL